MDTNETGTHAVDLNDIRAALGALTTRCAGIDSKLNTVLSSIGEIAANVERLAFLAQVLAEFRDVLDTDLPQMLDKLGDDPILGAFLGPYADLLKTTIAGGLERARALDHI